MRRKSVNVFAPESAIPHPRLEVREIVSLGAPEAVGQIRIGFVGGGRAGKYPR
jgi:hypothetical protein